jgi:hypothetical protein
MKTQRPMMRRTRPDLEPLEGRALLSDSGLAYRLTTDHSAYQLGQPVAMTFQETNVSGHPITVEYGAKDSGFVVRRDRRDGPVVWEEYPGPEYPQWMRMETLQPGQSLTLTATWDGIPTGGSAPVAGRFVISDQLDQLDPHGATATILVR